jgi:hypothetical protein
VLVVVRAGVASAADVAKPTVSITSPADNAQVTGTVTIGATAADDVGVVRLVLAIDGQPVLNQANGGPLSFSWNTVGLADAMHTIAVTAYDAAWNTTTRTISVRVRDVLPPTVAITSPAANADVTGTIQVTATAADAVGVTRMVLAIDGAVVSDGAASAVSYAWNTAPLVERSVHVLLVAAYDAAGNRNAATRAVRIRDVHGPIVSFGALTAGPLVAPTTDVTVSASDPSGVSRIVLCLDDVPVAQSYTTKTLGWHWDASGLALHSAHTLKALAVDSVGNVTTQSVSVTIEDTTPPTVVLSRPAQGQVVSGLEIVQVGASDDRHLARLTLRVNNTIVRDATDTDSFIYLFDAQARPDGATVLLSVTADDWAGNRSLTWISVKVNHHAVGGAPLGMAPTAPDDNRTVIPASFAAARAQGAQLLYWYQSWADAVASPNYVDTLMTSLVAGGSTAVNFDITVATQVGSYPPPFTTPADPGFADAFADFAASFAARYGLEYVFVGNEVNVYLDAHPEHADAIAALIRKTRERMRVVSPSTRVGVVLSHNYGVDHDQAALLHALADEADLVGYTVYGYEENGLTHEFYEPTSGIFALEDAANDYPGKPYAIVETGWNSSTTLSSSEADQATFVRLLRSSLRTSTAEFVSIFLYQDGQDCTQVVQSFHLPNLDPDPLSRDFQLFEDFVCHFGLRRADGTPKPAWDALLLP